MRWAEARADSPLESWGSHLDDPPRGMTALDIITFVVCGTYTTAFNQSWKFLIGQNDALVTSRMS